MARTLGLVSKDKKLRLRLMSGVMLLTIWRTSSPHTVIAHIQLQYVVGEESELRTKDTLILFRAISAIVFNRALEAGGWI